MADFEHQQAPGDQLFHGVNRHHDVDVGSVRRLLLLLALVDIFLPRRLIVLTELWTVPDKFSAGV